METVWQSGCDVTTLDGDRRVARRVKETEPESQSEQTCHRAPEVVCAVECCSLRKANLRVSGLCYIAGATHGLLCTEVILCVVVCLFTCVRNRVIAVVPAVTVPVPARWSAVVYRESTLSTRQPLSPHWYLYFVFSRGFLLSIGFKLASFAQCKQVRVSVTAVKDHFAGVQAARARSILD